MLRETRRVISADCAVPRWVYCAEAAAGASGLFARAVHFWEVARLPVKPLDHFQRRPGLRRRGFDDNLSA
jgi:hypothetical protein